MTDFDAWLVSGIIIGIIIMSSVFWVTTSLSSNIVLNNQTAKDICKNLTGNETVEARAEEGKLICEIPSYDHTTNIIVKKAGEDR